VDPFHDRQRDVRSGRLRRGGRCRSRRPGRTTPLTRAGKNVVLLTVTQALAMTAMIMNVTSSALAGYELAPDKSLATLAIACQFTATMLTTVPASMLMARIGRRPAFIFGASAQLTGALGSALAVTSGQFWLFCLCGACFGVANGFSMYYRFAAADTAD